MPSMASQGYVFTIARAAESLDEDENWLQEICMEMEPEDGHITVWDTSDMSTSAFTADEMENLKHFAEEHKRQRSALLKNESGSYFQILDPIVSSSLACNNLPIRPMQSFRTN